MSPDYRTGNGRTTAEWERVEPTPLFKNTECATPRPHFGNPVVENAIEAIAAKTGAPGAIAMHSVLATMSTVTQGFANVAGLGGSGPISLFFLTVAKSGERKSTCDKLATQALRDIEEARYRDYLQKQDRYEQAQAVSSTEPVVIEDEVDWLPSKPPVDPTILFSDSTTEGLLKHFEAGNPSIGVVSSEGGVFFGGHSMRRENRLKTAATLSLAWDEGRLDRHRATSESRTFRGKRVSLHLMVQPEIAEQALADRELIDQGFYSRILVAFPQSKIGTRLIENGPAKQRIDEKAEANLESYHARIRQLLDIQPRFDADEPLSLDPRCVSLNSAALTLLTDFYNRVESGQAPDGPFEHIQGFASKCPEHAVRLAAILAIFENEAAKTVNEQCMRDAVTVLEWHLAEMLRLRDCGYVSPDMRDAEKLRIWLLSNRSGLVITIRDITRHGPRPAVDAKRVRFLLDILEDHGWVLRRPPNTETHGTRHKWSWRVRQA